MWYLCYILSDWPKVLVALHAARREHVLAPPYSMESDNANVKFRAFVAYFLPTTAMCSEVQAIKGN